MDSQKLGHSLTLSTLLTLGRFAMIPFIIFAIIFELWTLALCLFIMAAITDLLDGALARLFDEQTELGAYLDPLVDKILILSCYGTLALSELTRDMVPAWFVLLVLLKESLLVGGAVYFGRIQKKVEIKPTIVGKAAMLVQSFFVGFLLLSLYGGRTSFDGVQVVHEWVVFLVIASFVHYAYVVLRTQKLWYFFRRAFYPS